VTIGDEHVAVCGDRDTSRPIEEVRSVPTHARGSDCHQYLAARADLQDRLAHRHASRILRGHAENGLVVVRIGRPDVAVLVDGEIRAGAQTVRRRSCAATCLPR
jgi:hypothetical protein